MYKSSRKELYFILGLFVLAFSIRFVYLNQMRSSPLFDVPLLDAAYHDEWAQAIVRGVDFEKGVFFRAPLYPYFLALIYKMFGHSLHAARFVQFLIGSLGCVLVYLIGKKIFNPTVGRIAGVIASFYGILIYFEGELLLEGLSVFLNLLLVLAVILAKAKPSYGRWLLCGVLLGLSALCRPNVLLVGVAFLFWMSYHFASSPEPSERRNQAYRRSLFYGLCFALGAILVISPVTARNYFKGHDLVLIASQDGMNFYIGNNPQSDGVSAFLPGARSTWWGLHDDATRMAEASLHRNLRPSEVSGFWYKQGMKFMTDHPLDFLKLMLEKLVFFWNGNELSNIKDIYFFARKNGILGMLVWKSVIFFPFGIICPLALLGMMLSRKQTEDSPVLLLFIFVYMLSVILFFVTARYRVPVLPFLIIFSAYALNWFAIKIKERKFWVAGKCILVLMFISIPLNLKIPGYQELGAACSHFNLGFAYSQKGDIASAIKEYNLALSHDTTMADAFANLGALYRQQGNHYQALQMFERALYYGADSATTLYGRGMVHYVMGSLEKAQDDYKLSLSLRDYDYFPHYLLGVVYADKRKWKEASEQFDLSLHYNPEFAPSYYELALIYRWLGRKKEAVSAVQNFIRLNRDYPEQSQEAKKLLNGLETR